MCCVGSLLCNLLGVLFFKPRVNSEQLWWLEKTGAQGGGVVWLLQ
jgi:hypothetical protein